MKVGEYRQIGEFRELVVARGGYVASNQPGQDYILCSMDECGNKGKNEINILVRTKSGSIFTNEEPEFNTYIFCSRRCRLQWWNEARSDPNKAGQLDW